MKILIIEDDKQKTEQIISFLKKFSSITEIQLEKSYNSGLRTVTKESFDLLLLDMSLPTFEITVDESGGKPMSFAGEEILRQLHRKKITVPTIVITQYDRFEKGLSLSQIKSSIESKGYPNYIDTIYYNTTNDSWVLELTELLQNKVGIKE
ncbi:response regulator [Kurthia gibsonii]|uniref:response regulator n=1 Tax=Kurthia gibsonii TaxID=33946 RepID=UPI003F232ACF